MKKFSMLAALAAVVLWSGVALAVGDIVQAADGTYRNIRTGQYTDADGNLLGVDADRDRDYSQVKNIIGPITSLAPGNSVTSTSAIALGEFNSLLVMVSWNTAAAADSDSVAIALKFIGKISTDVNDGYDFSVSSPGDSAFLLRADTTVVTLGLSSTGNTGGVLVPMPTVLIIARGKATITGAAGDATPTLVPLGNPWVYDLYPKTTTNMLASRTRPYRVPPAKIVWSDGRHGVAFVLSAPGGAPFAFSHLMAVVQNLNRIQTYTNVKVDVWPKVN